jgi:hypothetical protein
VRTAEDLKAMFAPADAAEAAAMGMRARATLDSLSGATERCLAAIEREMSHAPDAA